MTRDKRTLAEQILARAVRKPASTVSSDGKNVVKHIQQKEDETKANA